MQRQRRNSNRNPLRLLFVFRLAMVLVIFSMGIAFFFIPEKVKNQELFGGVFVAYGLLRGYRLYVDYRNGKFEPGNDDE